MERHEEQRDPLHYRFLKAFLRGSFEGSANAPRMNIADAEGIRGVAEKLIRKAAEEGNAVIVGPQSYFAIVPDAYLAAGYSGQTIGRMIDVERSSASAGPANPPASGRPQPHTSYWWRGPASRNAAA